MLAEKAWQHVQAHEKRAANYGLDFRANAATKSSASSYTTTANAATSVHAAYSCGL